MLHKAAKGTKVGGMRTANERQDTRMELQVRMRWKDGRHGLCGRNGLEARSKIRRSKFQGISKLEEFQWKTGPVRTYVVRVNAPMCR